ncbi:hypothetical protein ACVILK_004238 [Bradyrhizobium embrapense]
MFEKLAKFRQASPRRVVEPRQIPPRTATYSNDNLPGFRRPVDRRRPTPACHWILIDGRLECRWIVDDTGGDLDRQRRAGRRFGLRASARHAAAVRLGGRHGRRT